MIDAYSLMLIYRCSKERKLIKKLIGNIQFDQVGIKCGVAVWMYLGTSSSKEKVSVSFRLLCGCIWEHPAATKEDKESGRTGGKKNQYQEEDIKQKKKTRKAGGREARKKI